MKLYSLSAKRITKLDPKEVTIAVYGLGKMGLPLAVVFAKRGFRVTGVDPNEKIVTKINKGINPLSGEKGLDQLLKKVVKKKLFKATTDGIFASKISDVKIILVPVLIDHQNNPALSILLDVTTTIARGLKKGDIVILESTVPPGTTMGIFSNTLEKISGLKINRDFGVAHCPERISSGTAITDIKGRLCPKIIGASDIKTSLIAATLYRRINKRGAVTVQNSTVAELVKIWGEVYRDVNIAFANNLYLVCKEFGIDALEVIKASNTNPYSKILMPGPGVGGHCIPVYPYFLLQRINQNQTLLKEARRINDFMPQHVIDLTLDALQEKGIPFEKATVLILGLSYRDGVKEIRQSPGVTVARKIRKYIPHVFVYDPLFSKKEIGDLDLQYKKDFLKVDCVIITTAESAFTKLNWKKISEAMRTKVVIDTKNIINAKKMTILGFTIRRIGYAK